MRKENLIIGLAGMAVASITTVATTYIITNNKSKAKELERLEAELKGKAARLKERESNLKAKIEVSRKDIQEKEKQLAEREAIARKLAGSGNEAIMDVVSNIQNDLTEIKKATDYTRQELRISNSMREYIGQ